MSQHFCLTQEGFELGGGGVGGGRGREGEKSQEKAYSAVFPMPGMPKGKWLTWSHFHERLIKIITE